MCLRNACGESLSRTVRITGSPRSSGRPWRSPLRMPSSTRCSPSWTPFPAVILSSTSSPGRAKSLVFPFRFQRRRGSSAVAPETVGRSGELFSASSKERRATGASGRDACAAASRGAAVPPRRGSQRGAVSRRAGTSARTASRLAEPMLLQEDALAAALVDKVKKSSRVQGATTSEFPEILFGELMLATNTARDGW